MMDLITRKRLVPFLLMSRNAFDTIWHPVVIYKLPVFIFFLMLSHQNIYCPLYVNKFSTPHPVNAGVSQSSKLGPWLYKIYIHDISRLHTLVTLYVDDIRIMVRNTDMFHTRTFSHTYIYLNFFNFFSAKAWIKLNYNDVYTTAVFFSRKRISSSPLILNGSLVNFAGG